MILRLLLPPEKVSSLDVTSWSIFETFGFVVSVGLVSDLFRSLHSVFVYSVDNDVCCGFVL